MTTIPEDAAPTCEESGIPRGLPKRGLAGKFRLSEGIPAIHFPGKRPHWRQARAHPMPIRLGERTGGEVRRGRWNSVVRYIMNSFPISQGAGWLR